jgi:hypothetical protein
MCHRNIFLKHLQATISPSTSPSLFFPKRSQEPGAIADGEGCPRRLERPNERRIAPGHAVYTARSAVEP